jgi:hypothetical protein
LKSFNLAYLEARSLHINAKKVNTEIQNMLSADPNINDKMFGEIVTCNILIGLSIELYLKTYMLRNRVDGIIKGHKLNILFNTFPQKYKDYIIDNYNKIFIGNDKMIELAFIFSGNQPDKPKIYSKVDFSNFEESLEAISNIFVQSRYFFEEINSNEWSILPFYFEAADAIATSLELTFEKILNGEISVN